MTEETGASEPTYVAFCDILGFSERTVSKFEETLDIYKQFGQLLAGFPIREVELTMYSDAILLTSKSLMRILQGVQAVLFFALSQNLMIRGGIACGKYWQLKKDNHLLVVSDALVRAVKLEKLVGVPAVVLADDIKIPDVIWIERFRMGAVKAPLLHFRDRSIVNPFNEYWFASAHFRASELMNESPNYRDKYLWFLALHEAIAGDADLVPPKVLTEFLEKGVITQRDEAK